MTATTTPAPPAQSPADKVGQRRADKVAQRRDELARVTLKTLSELGYARTSLREIAANSQYSHGVLHYYFADKVDLITHCVRMYKSECITRYDHLLAAATDAEGLRRGFAEQLGASLDDDLDMHRLWYDLRSQSMFEPAFVDDVEYIDTALRAMIWRVVGRYGELTGAAVTVDEGTAYAMFDGLFHHALVQQGHGDTTATERLVVQAGALLPRLVDSD